MLQSVRCALHQLIGPGDVSFFKDVRIYSGRVVPFGYYQVIHRDSFTADADFYVRILAFTFFFILARVIVARYIVKSLGQPLALKKSNYMKLEEAVMQVSFYAWSWAYNAAFVVRQDWFWHPIICMLDAFPRSDIEPEISFYYSAQIGWYIHGIYTHFFLDSKKSDFAIMIVHHVVTLSLLYGAFVVGYFRIGMLVMFSMDICDVFLYSAKILKTVKSGGKVDYPKAVYYIGFGMIPVSWFLFRLIYFPLVVMQMTFLDSICSAGYDNTDGWLPFNVLLFILLGLNAWWFWVIVKIMWTSLTSKNLQALDDIREDDRDEGLSGQDEKRKSSKSRDENTASRVPKKNQ